MNESGLPVTKLDTLSVLSISEQMEKANIEMNQEKCANGTIEYKSIEFDPNGIGAHAPGAKMDAGKPMVDDILSGFPRALLAISSVGTFGAKKYSLNGWMEVENGIRRYRNAAGRHRLKTQMGEIVDEESNFPHRFLEAWNVLASLELELREQEKEEEYQIC